MERSRKKNYICDYCGLTFRTEGSALHCPRCHSLIKKRVNER